MCHGNILQLAVWLVENSFEWMKCLFRRLLDTEKGNNDLFIINTIKKSCISLNIYLYAGNWNKTFWKKCDFVLKTFFGVFLLKYFLLIFVQHPFFQQYFCEGGNFCCEAWQPLHVRDSLTPSAILVQHRTLYENRELCCCRSLSRQLTSLSSLSNRRDSCYRDSGGLRRGWYIIPCPPPPPPIITV